jgi:hypothetical protein
MPLRSMEEAGRDDDDRQRYRDVGDVRRHQPATVVQLLVRSERRYRHRGADQRTRGTTIAVGLMPRRRAGASSPELT